MKNTLKSNVMGKILCVGLLFAGVFSLNAQTASELKAKMKDRLPAIERLKNSGALGENNQGYLQVRKNEGDAQSIANAENGDRQKVYKAIAAKNRTTAELVGKRRALQIVERGQKNQWFQNDRGEWYQIK